ncbi:hypothetical protein TpMuguga_01g00268 [Theileria parva strain Muguga]|uniref:Uncharacterized protein n=1 Tax=Theileria parva TaxID=5875 RepID=Q4N946_THEPA|nr:uncharacterized protein TpMuguga_01g00268 [Theileria parva strain Muguga]EAN33512.1 hypothetical protein TpMuguga_01g00268 [Theileria parva strain Muguga]|eukprot:XP_765795.1 hypothetical protein [Theileria parva strain Muguga]
MLEFGCIFLNSWMIRILKAILINQIINLITNGVLIVECVGNKESTKIANILTGNITGDVVPSTYPSIKINQSANNDSNFYNFYKDELRELEEETMELMDKQRKVFEDLRRKAKEQNKIFEDLSIAVQRQ